MATISHSQSADKKCQHDTTYELNHALVQLIQKTTGEQTHVIMNNIIAETNAMLKELEINPNCKTAGAKWESGWRSTKEEWHAPWTPKRRNKLVTYPNSDIKFNLIITIRWHENLRDSKYIDGKWVLTKNLINCNELKVKVVLPNKILSYSTGDMSMLLAEGDILDESTAIEDFEIKQSKPPRKKKKSKTDTIEEEKGEEV